MGSSKRSADKPKKRTLVRWDENLNELLLLSVQSVCNSQAVRIPWADVARTMGHNASEGAIVQHLAKLRTRRVAAGKPVPPPLRRSTAGGPSTPRGKSSRNNTTARSHGMMSRSKSKNRLAKQKDNDRPDNSDGEEAENIDYEYDTSSDEEYGKRSRKNTTKRKATTANATGLQSKRKIEDIEIKLESDTDDSVITSDGDPDELVCVGASFLQYPNDKPIDPPSSSPQSAKESKIVKLKYKTQEVSATNELHPNVADFKFPVNFENHQQAHPAESHFDTAYHNPYQEFSGSNEFGGSFMNTPNPHGLTENKETIGSQVGYYGASTPMDHAQLDPGNGNTAPIDPMSFAYILSIQDSQYQNFVYSDHSSGLFGQELMRPGGASFTGDSSRGTRYYLDDNVGMNEGF